MTNEIKNVFYINFISLVFVFRELFSSGRYFLRKSPSDPIFKGDKHFSRICQHKNKNYYTLVTKEEQGCGLSVINQGFADKDKLNRFNTAQITVLYTETSFPLFFVFSFLFFFFFFVLFCLVLFFFFFFESVSFINRPLGSIQYIRNEKQAWNWLINVFFNNTN